MKYINKYNTETAYKSAKQSELFAIPHVSLIAATNEIRYDPIKAVKFTSTGNSTLSLSSLSSNQSVWYSNDLNNWNILDTATTINLSDGETVFVRGLLTGDNSDNNYTQFSITGSVSVTGEISAFWNYLDLNAPLKSFCGYRLFGDCTGIITAAELILPETKMSEFSYSSMFAGCTNITAAPNLPAKNSHNYCYASMFARCTKLVIPPVISLTNAMTRACYRMFEGCTSLVTAPALSAAALGTSCYSNMFAGCSSLINAPELPATTLAQACYSGMFTRCSSLITAPILPATNLASGCYTYMFQDCKKLSYVKCLATSIDGGTTGWMIGVASTGTFIKNALMNDWTSGTSGIPTGWTVENYSET